MAGLEETSRRRRRGRAHNDEEEGKGWQVVEHKSGRDTRESESESRVYPRAHRDGSTGKRRSAARRVTYRR